MGLGGKRNSVRLCGRLAFCYVEKITFGNERSVFAVRLGIFGPSGDDIVFEMIWYNTV